MGKNSAQLNFNQVAVLGWIRDGCPDGVYSAGYEHRIIARALERRGFVSISGRGRTWTATITDAGRHFNDAPPGVVLPDESEADRLIAAVIEAGQLVLPEDHEIVKAHELLVKMSLKSPSRPRGKKLEMVSTGRWASGPKSIVFTEHFDDLVEAQPVPIPERITRYHPAVKAFMQDKEWQYVTSDHVQRAARILQAIAIEAATRGMDVGAPDVPAEDLPMYQRRGTHKSQLSLRTPAGEYQVQLKEIPGPGAPKVQPRARNARKTKPAWIDSRGWEFISTGRLELVVLGPGTGYNGERFRDVRATTVEVRLPEVFRAIEISMLRADWQEQERARKEAERQRSWQAAMASAEEQYFVHARWEHFKDRSHEWHSINQHRLFLAAAQKALEQYSGEDREAIRQQLNGAEHTLDTLDPIGHLSQIVPDVPAPKPDDLKPFLNGRSPYGPSGLAW